MRIKERIEMDPARAFAEALEVEDQGFFVYLPPGARERIRNGNPSSIILIDKRKRPKALRGYSLAVAEIEKVLRDPLKLDADLEDPIQWERIVAVHGPKVRNNGGYVNFPAERAAKIEVYHIKGVSGGVIVVRDDLFMFEEIEAAKREFARLTPAQILEHRDFARRASQVMGRRAASAGRHRAV